jgi:hypothetical protein
LTTLATCRGRLFAELAQQYDHHRFSRRNFAALGNSDLFLNGINVEVQQGLTEAYRLEAL